MEDEIIAGTVRKWFYTRDRFSRGVTVLEGGYWITMSTGARDNRGHNVFNTVLVLSGDDLVRTVIVQLLRECGYRVLQAANSDEALTMLQTSDISIDVVLTEIDVPGSRNGFGLAQWARLVRPKAKIMLAGTLERMARNAADLSEIGPLRTRTYEHELVLEQLKRL